MLRNALPLPCSLKEKFQTFSTLQLLRPVKENTCKLLGNIQNKLVSHFLLLVIISVGTTPNVFWTNLALLKMMFSVRQSLLMPYGTEACWTQRAFHEVQTLHIFLKILNAVNPRLPFPNPISPGRGRSLLEDKQPVEPTGCKYIS